MAESRPRPYPALSLLGACLIAACATPERDRAESADAVRAVATSADRSSSREARQARAMGQSAIARDLAARGINLSGQGAEAELREAVEEYERVAVAGAAIDSAAVEEALGRVNFYLRASGAKSNVTATTDRPGARVMYRLIGEATVKPFFRPTGSSEELDIGYYFMWTERNGVPTSRKERYDLIKPQVDIHFDEE